MPTTPAPMSLAYCTNVHAGDTLETNLAALDAHAVAVRRLLGVDTLPIGWWLSANSLADLRREGDRGVERVRRFLAERGLDVVTFNGFPFGDFHAPIVKHAVYRPDWMDPRRAEYTVQLAGLLAALRPRGADASISTLPIGWPSNADPTADLALAAGRLLDVVEALRALRDRTDVRIHVDLEPEPGCLLQRSQDVARFAERFLWPAASLRGLAREAVAEHLGVCHDVCHAAVMGEEQAACVAAYRIAGLPVGKVQVSSALAVDLDGPPGEVRARLAALRAFAEGRYLHQTMIRDRDGTHRFFDDLPWALATLETEAGRDRSRAVECRVHFHVPVHLAGIELATGDGAALLGTTHGAIAACLAALRPMPTLEVETYAWNVLPTALGARDLASGIVEELRWTARSIQEVVGAPPEAGA